MAYKPLDSETVIHYLRGRSALNEVLPDADSYTATEVGDGNLNLVFIVVGRDDPSHTAVVKQALPYLRVAGESWPLNRDRVVFETEALLLQDRLAPGMVPRVYDHDYDMSLVVMENLDHHEVMRKPLARRERFPKFVDQITTFLANTLFFTSDMYMHGEQKKELQRNFINPELCRIQEDFVFTNPYFRSPENQWNALLDQEAAEVRQDKDLKRAVAELKEAYMTHAQALIHSDLHTGSIMVNKTETRVFDPEFAFVGPMGFDVGALLANLILSYASHFVRSDAGLERDEYQAYLLSFVRDIWSAFAAKFDELWVNNNSGDLMETPYWQFAGGDEAFAAFRKSYVDSLLHDSAGFAGAEMLRRMLGIVSVWDISSIEDATSRAVAERFMLRVGRRWILEGRSVATIDDLVGIVREEAKSVDA